MRSVAAALFSLPLVFLNQTAASDASRLETAPPVVVKTEPQAGVADVDPGLKEIRVTFSKDMLDQSYSVGIVTKEVFPAITGKPKYLEDKRTCVIPVALEADHTYSMWMNTASLESFRDKDQRPAVPYLLVFKTLKAKK